MQWDARFPQDAVKVTLKRGRGTLSGGGLT